MRAKRTLTVTTPTARLGNTTQELNFTETIGARIRRQARRNQRQIECSDATDLTGARNHTRIPTKTTVLL